MRRRIDIAASLVTHARDPVPGRADDGPRPAQPQPGVGSRPPDRGRRHDGAAHDAVPGGGRPPRRAAGGHRPRAGHRRGDEPRAQGVRSAATRCTFTWRTRSSAPRRRRSSPACWATASCPAPDPTAFSVKVDGRRRRPPTCSARCRAPRSSSRDFSLGTPSLDDVFFALTGRPAEDKSQRRKPARRARREHGRHPDARARRSSCAARREARLRAVGRRSRSPGARCSRSSTSRFSCST